MGVDLEKTKRMIDRNEHLSAFSVRRQGAELHLEKGGETFARLRPATEPDGWQIEVFRETEDWEILDYQGTLEECLEFLTDHPHYLFWNR